MYLAFRQVHMFVHRLKTVFGFLSANLTLNLVTPKWKENLICLEITLNIRGGATLYWSQGVNKGLSVHRPNTNSMLGFVGAKDQY